MESTPFQNQTRDFKPNRVKKMKRTNERTNQHWKFATCIIKLHCSLHFFFHVARTYAVNPATSQWFRYFIPLINTSFRCTFPSKMSVGGKEESLFELQTRQKRPGKKKWKINASRQKNPALSTVEKRMHHCRPWKVFLSTAIRMVHFERGGVRVLRPSRFTYEHNTYFYTWLLYD